MATSIVIKLLNKNIDDLLDNDEFLFSYETGTFNSLKDLIKEAYKGSTRLTNNDIGFLWNSKPLLDFPPLNQKSLYNLTDESPLRALEKISTTEAVDGMFIIELDLLINVDGFFREYEPVFTDGLLRSEGYGLFSTILNTNYNDIMNEGTSLINPDENKVESEKVLKDKSYNDSVENMSHFAINQISPKITFIDSKTKKRVKILSDVNSSDLVLIEIEDFDNDKNQKGYIPRARIDEISTFYLDFFSRYSGKKQSIEIDGRNFKEIVGFKFNTMFIKKDFLLNNDVITKGTVNENESNSTDNVDNDMIAYEMEGYDVASKQFDDLRAIFDPRSPITERVLSFFSIIFKTVYLVVRHSILAFIVTLNLTNFIPVYCAILVTFCNFVYTMITDKEIQKIWAEYLKSHKMLDTEYNEIISMVQNSPDIPLYIVLQLHDNQLVKDQISDYLRKTKDMQLMESLYGLVKNDKSMNDIKLKDIEDFINISQLSPRVVPYPYKTIDINSRKMVVEPDLRDTILDDFVDKFFLIMKKRLDVSCSSLGTKVTDDLEDKIKRNTRMLFGNSDTLVKAFQRPLYKLIVDNLNFWKINNFHLKPHTIARWRVDFDDTNNKADIDTEMKRIDTDLNNMVHTIVDVKKHPDKYITFENKSTIKDPFFWEPSKGLIKMGGTDSPVFAYEEGKLVLLEDSVVISRNWKEEKYKFNIFNEILGIMITLPIKLFKIIFVDVFSMLIFFIKFVPMNKSEWFAILKRNAIEGDIVYNYLPKSPVIGSIGSILPSYTVLFVLALVPAYQEKIDSILKERERIVEQMNRELERYWEKQDYLKDEVDLQGEDNLEVEDNLEDENIPEDEDHLEDEDNELSL